MLKSPFTTGQAWVETIAIAGGGATETETIKGLKVGDKIFWAPKDIANAVYLKDVAVTAVNTVLFTFSGDPGAASIECLFFKSGV